MLTFPLRLDGSGQEKKRVNLAGGGDCAGGGLHPHRDYLQLSDIQLRVSERGSGVFAQFLGKLPGEKESLVVAALEIL
jgi:hypothetical protein